MKGVLLILFIGLLSTEIPPSEMDLVTGVWFNTEKSGKVSIYKEGKSYFGKIVWLEEPLNENGQTKKDVNNPDPAERFKGLIGLVVLKNFKSDGNGKYGDGTIYDPENGKTYKCKMTLKGDQLNVRGYIGIPALGRTEKWTRPSE